MELLPQDKEKILVVTKSIDFQQELRKALDQYLLIVVDDAEQAIQKLTNNGDYSAVLVGIYLDETKGFELLEYFKNNVGFYNGPVLILTDSVNDDVINKIKDYDIFDYIIRYSHANLIKTTVRNAVVYYTEKSKLLNYAVEQVFESFNDMKLLLALLAQVLEFKSFDAGAHVEHVGMITRILCNELIKLYPDKYNLDSNDAYYISLASCLHDIGKIYIPDHVLNKPDKLTREEKEIINEHATLGAGIISRLPNYQSRKLFKYAYDICLCHHERFNGTGYPKKLMYDEIPIWAQIVSVADCYDALTSDRVYRKAYDHVAAMTMIANGGCGNFNPDLIECLWACEEAIIAAKSEHTTAKVAKDAFQTAIKDVLKIK